MTQQFSFGHSNIRTLTRSLYLTLSLSLLISDWSSVMCLQFMVVEIGDDTQTYIDTHTYRRVHTHTHTQTQTNTRAHTQTHEQAVLLSSIMFLHFIDVEIGDIFFLSLQTCLNLLGCLIFISYETQCFVCHWCFTFNCFDVFFLPHSIISKLNGSVLRPFFWRLNLFHVPLGLLLNLCVLLDPLHSHDVRLHIWCHADQPVENLSEHFQASI